MAGIIVAAVYVKAVTEYPSHQFVSLRAALGCGLSGGARHSCFARMRCDDGNDSGQKSLRARKWRYGQMPKVRLAAFNHQG